MSKRIGIIMIIMCVMMVNLGCENKKSEFSEDAKPVVEAAPQEKGPEIIQPETVESEPETTQNQVEVQPEAIQNQAETVEAQPETVQSQEQTLASQPELAQTQQEAVENQAETMPIMSDQLQFADPKWSFDEEKLAKAIELGFESPYQTIEKSDYQPYIEDVIQYDSTLSDEALYQSIKYKGIEGLEIVYDIDKLNWNDFFGDLDYTQYESVKSVSLKNASIYEAETIDDNEKYYRYYDENEGVYYEVSELMMGNFTDPDAVLTKKVMGNACFYKGLSELSEPTYNPFILEKNESLLRCEITSLEGEPVIYIEKELEHQLYEEWISIKYGVLLKQLVFDSEGLLKKRSVSTSVANKVIDDTVFYKPNDVEFRDITLFIYSMTGGDTKTLAGAVENTVLKEPHSMTLQSDAGVNYRIHSGGLEEMKLDKPLYLTKGKSMNGEERTIIQYRNENDFYTVCPELKIVEIYENSSLELRFFNFETVGLYSVTEAGNMKNYTFYDNHVDSVSGMIRFYEYVIDGAQNKIIAINVFNKESLTDDMIAGQVETYKIVDVGLVDENLYKIPSDYKIIDHGDKSNNDGENMPFWYQ